MGYVGGIVYGKNTVCGMVCVDGMVREKHSIRYGMFAVWYHGTVLWVYYMAKFAWWYSVFQYIRPVRVEYVVRISSVTTLYIDYWKVFKDIRHADRDRFAFTAAETHFYKLRIAEVVEYMYGLHCTKWDMVGLRWLLRRAGYISEPLLIKWEQGILCP